MRVLAIFVAAGLFVQTQQAPPLIRSRITIVPIDVRVVDKDGKPVTGLTQDDFIVLEEGVAQPIKVFTPHAFTADRAAAAAPLELRAPSADASGLASNRRVFLLIAGRGRHQVVSKYVDEMSRFVSQLLPQDQVAFMAWNRATDFTADHGMIRAVLASFAQRHESVEADLRNWFSGLRAVYGSKEIPQQIQARIDAVFAPAASLRPRSMRPSTDVAARSGVARDNAAEIQRNEIVGARPADKTLPDTRAQILAELGGMTFEDYIQQASETFQDLGALYSAIDYLRYIEGEKHIVYLTERGVYLPLLGGNMPLARVASDARIALNVIQTGGVAGAPPPRTVMNPGGRVDVIMSPVPSFSAISGQTFSMQDMRDVSELTGGRLASFTRAETSFATIAEGLDYQYVLGYVPSRDANDGRFRRIEVKVRRPGVDVHYRRGYFATAAVLPLDRREFTTVSRIRNGAEYSQPITDIGVKVTNVSLSQGSLTVALTIDVKRVSFKMADGHHVAFLDVAVFVAGHGNKNAGELVRRAEIKLTPELYARALKEGVGLSATVSLTGPAAYLKAVVYDYNADLLGTVRGDLR